jgi:hypothetical protein
VWLSQQQQFTLLQNPTKRLTAALWVASALQAIAMITDCKKSKALSAQIRQGIRAYEEKPKA